MKISLGGTEFQVEDQRASLFCADGPVIARYWQPKPNDVCLDIGCGPGAWSLVALARGAFCFSFDPRLLAVEILAKQVCLNRFCRSCIVPSGLLDVTGNVGYHEDIGTYDQRANNTAPSITLDDFANGLGITKIDYINMDVEGTADKVIKGGREILRDCQPKIIIELDKGTEKERLIDNLLTLNPDYKFEVFANEFLVCS